MFPKWSVVLVVIAGLSGCTTLQSKRFDGFEVNPASATYEEACKTNLTNCASLFIPEALQVQPLTIKKSQHYFTNCRLLLDPGKQEFAIRMIRDDYVKDSLQVTTKVILRKRLKPRTAYSVTGERQGAVMIFKLTKLTNKEKQNFEFSLIEERRERYQPAITFTDVVVKETIIHVTGNKMDFRKVHLSNSGNYLVYEKSGRTDSGLSVHRQRAVIATSLSQKRSHRVLTIGTKDYAFHNQSSKLWLAGLKELYLWNNKEEKKEKSFEFDTKYSGVNYIEQIIGVLSETEVLIEAQTTEGPVIYRVNFESQKAEPLSAGKRAALSKNNDKLFFIENKKMYIMDIKSGLKKQLFIQLQPRQLSSEPAWSYNGKWIAFSAAEKGWQHQNRSDLFVVNTDSGEMFQLTTKGNALWPCWDEKGDLFFVDSRHNHPEAIIKLKLDLSPQ